MILRHPGLFTPRQVDEFVERIKPIGNIINDESQQPEHGNKFSKDYKVNEENLAKQH
jgi:hypothetical protein